MSFLVTFLMGISHSFAWKKNKFQHYLQSQTEMCEWTSLSRMMGGMHDAFWPLDAARLYTLDLYVFIWFIFYI